MRALRGVGAKSLFLRPLKIRGDGANVKVVGSKTIVDLSQVK
jgi:hypothetical protein